MTVDQKDSRHRADLVDELLADLADVSSVRPFERTAGDEVQAVLDDPAVVVDTALSLVRRGGWSVGIGCGPVEEPLPRTARAGRGPAFVLAREAVTRAKSSPERVALEAADTSAGAAADALLSLLAAVRQRRSPEGWQALDLLQQGLSQTEVAQRLAISKQAVSARVRAALWAHEQRITPLLVSLVAAADDSRPQQAGMSAGDRA